MQAWEIKKIWLQFGITVSSDNSRDHTYYAPSWTDETRKAWAEAEALAASGWELVGGVPELVGHEINLKIGIAAAGSGCSYSTGMYLLFKRPKQ